MESLAFITLLLDPGKAAGAGGSSPASKDAEQQERILLFMLMRGCWKCPLWGSLCRAPANISHLRGWCEGGFQNVSSADYQGMFPHASFLLCVFPCYCPIGTGTGQPLSTPSLPSAPAALLGHWQTRGEAGRLRSCTSCYSIADTTVAFSYKATQWPHGDKLSQTCGCHNASK